MNDWEKFNETSLHSYSKLNMEDIADAITSMEKEFAQTLK